MAKLMETDVRAALCDFLARSVLSDGVVVTVDAPLADLGVDSFSLMEVLLFVEQRFGVELPMASLTPENTHDVAALTRCVLEVSGRA